MEYEERKKQIIHYLDNGSVFHAKTEIGLLIKELGYTD